MSVLWKSPVGNFPATLPEGNRQELGLTSKQWWNMRNSPARIVKNGDWTIEPTKIDDFNWDFTKPSPMEFNAIYPLVIHFGSYGTWSTNASMICPPGMLRTGESLGTSPPLLGQTQLWFCWVYIYIYARYCIVLYWSYIYIKYIYIDIDTHTYPIRS